jgi:hypothetical protein
VPEWYQRRYIIDFCRKRSRLISMRGIRYINTMPPRRRVEPPVENRAMEREMRELCARLDAMETTQRRAPDAGDVSDAEMKKWKLKKL